MVTIEQLAAELDAAEAVPAAWRAAFLAVPRHHFIPSQIWMDDEHGTPQPLSRDHDPDQWLAAAYRNVPILTQFDDGQTVWPDTSGELCTSSASKPDLVLSMLDALDVHAGHTVLEIGTGTGYNAALLAARVGPHHVTTVEIDPALADAARTALHTCGFPATVLSADGTQGGVIVTPMRTDFGGTVALVRFTVGENGTATGRPVGRVGFMALRSQRTPQWCIDHFDPDDRDAEVSTTTLKPWRVAENHDVRWATGTQVPSCVWEHQPPAGDRAHHLPWLLDPAGGSWALARYDGGPGVREIRQYGLRRLWDEVEAAFRHWAVQGKPRLDQSRITITWSAQTIVGMPTEPVR